MSHIPSHYVKQPDGSYAHPSRVGAVLPTKPKQDTLSALDHSKETCCGVSRKMACRITIIRRGKKCLDDDNLAFAYKGLRDAIAWSLDIDDADPRIEWRYEQITGKPYGTIVMFTT